MVPKAQLNFICRLVMASLRVIDYIVVHELVHIEFADYSKEYWVRVWTGQLCLTLKSSVNGWKRTRSCWI